MRCAHLACAALAVLHAGPAAAQHTEPEHDPAQVHSHRGEGPHFIDAFHNGKRLSRTEDSARYLRVVRRRWGSVYRADRSRVGGIVSRVAHRPRPFPSRRAGRLAAADRPWRREPRRQGRGDQQSARVHSRHRRGPRAAHRRCRPRPGRGPRRGRPIPARLGPVRSRAPLVVSGGDPRGLLPRIRPRNPWRGERSGLLDVAAGRDAHRGRSWKASRNGVSMAAPQPGGWPRKCAGSSGRPGSWVPAPGFASAGRTSANWSWPSG